MRWGTDCSLPTAAPATFNFMPSWWFREYGISYGERAFTDPEYRAQAYRDMSRLAFERFGDVGLGSPDPPLAYLNGDIANATMPAALGCEVVFADDRYAVNLPLSPEKGESLQAPRDIAEAFPMREIIRQAAYVREKRGQNLQPQWCCMGPQNIAVQTCGSDFFAAYGENPTAAAKMLDIAAQLMLSSVDYFIAAGSNPGIFWTHNCTVALSGPAHYQTWLLPYERMLHAQAEQRGMGYAIHHCGHFDIYAPLYRRVDRFQILEVGWGSDLRLALDTFPEAQVQTIVSHQLIQDGSPAAIRDAMRSLVAVAGADLGRVIFSIPDLEHGTPDEHVRAVVEALLSKR